MRRSVSSRLRPWRIVACLALGALVTVLTTWLMAMALPAGPNDPYAPPTTRHGYERSIPASLGPATRAFRTSAPWNEYWQVQWDGPDEPEYRDDAVASVYRFGFPLRALESRHAWVGPASPLDYRGPPSLGAIEMPEWRAWLMLVRTPNTQYTSWFPWLPIWPGVALNTIVYGTLAFILWGGLLRWRRARRVRRGRCASCNYDLAGLGVCPECGVVPRSTPRTE